MFADELGDRMKGHERVETARIFDKDLPVYARIDGRGFSRFTRGMNRPFDARMTAAMQATTAELVRSTGARIGYTQSDEISLVWLVGTENPRSQMVFGGKTQKMCSLLASQATALFTRELLRSDDAEFRAFAERMPQFDTRVFQLPSREEAVNALIWRESDARRNAVSMVAHDRFSPKQLHGKKVTDMIAMLSEVGIEFDAFPTAFRNGTYVKEATVQRQLAASEISAIPEHRRVDPATVFTRSVIEFLTDAPLVSQPNRLEFVFGPEVTEDTNEYSVDKVA